MIRVATNAVIGHSPFVSYSAAQLPNALAHDQCLEPSKHDGGCFRQTTEAIADLDAFLG
jgi:hypothetical protein